MLGVGRRNEHALPLHDASEFVFCGVLCVFRHSYPLVSVCVFLKRVWCLFYTQGGLERWREINLFIFLLKSKGIGVYRRTICLTVFLEIIWRIIVTIQKPKKVGS